MHWRLTETLHHEHDEATESSGADKRSFTLFGWGVILSLAALLVWGGPFLWMKIEALPLDTEYRIPDANSEDYWLISQWLRHTDAANSVLMLGDSVVWGQYATPEQTLSACLNRRFVDGVRHWNLGVNGAHPLAWLGLIKKCGAAFSGRRIVLYFNPLWISSPGLDLQAHQESARLFHPSLLPQFDYRLTAYDADLADRLDVTVTRHLPLRELERHWRITWLNGKNWDSWMMDHPHDLPASVVSRQMPIAEDKPLATPLPWHQSGGQQTSAEWVAADDSRQVAAFLMALEQLQSQDNQVLVLLGSYNTHMLPEENTLPYRAAMAEIEKRIDAQGVTQIRLPVLPSDRYGDATHPLPAGYEEIASLLAMNPVYCQWLGQNPTDLPEASEPIDPLSPVPSRPREEAKKIQALQSFIAGGRFVMGDGRGRSDETPHQVVVSDFYMDRTPVTQEFYESVMGVNPARNKGANLPVEQVRWAEAIEFCNRSSALEGLTPCYDLTTGACDFSANGYRLPTEAEWEYACRAGGSNRYAFGDSSANLDAFAWFVGNSGGKTRPVGDKLPNAYKLYDMNGNVWEWCNDWYAPYPTDASETRDPTGPATGTFKVLRGGAFDSPSDRFRAAYRFKAAPAYTDVCEGYSSFGFRRVRRAGTGKEN